MRFQLYNHRFAQLYLQFLLNFFLINFQLKICLAQLLWYTKQFLNKSYYFQLIYQFKGYSPQVCRLLLLTYFAQPLEFSHLELVQLLQFFYLQKKTNQINCSFCIFTKLNFLIRFYSFLQYFLQLFQNLYLMDIISSNLQTCKYKTMYTYYTNCFALAPLN